MALQLRRKTHESVVYIDKDSAPRIMPFGEDFILEDIPIGTRVIYPNPPIQGLPNREAAIRYAINHPLDAKPLYAQLEPGMKITIAMDDISLPLPPMATPDLRQTMLEVVLDLCYANGVDDIHLIIANSLHRKMTEWEMKRMVGSKIHNAFYPERYYNHDAEDDDNLVTLGYTRHNEPLRINRRAAESDILIYLNINLVPMDGGHKSVAVGLCDYESLRAHHEPQTIRDSHSYMDPPASELNHKVVRLGKLVDEHCNVFHIETALNNKMFSDGYDILTKNEDEFTFADRMKWEAMRRTFSKMPRGARRKMLHAIPAQYEMIACYAGETELVHDKILEKNYQQYEIPVKGQCDILITGIPDISPYNVYSTLNPLLVQVMAMGYHFNMYRNKPLLRKGGVMILTHPCMDEFDHNFHPSYIEFFHRLLPESRDAFYLREKYEREFASNPSYVEMYRRGNAYHGAHPFFMWYWGENGRQHCGKVIAAGAENSHVPAMLGWERADNLTEAIAMARSFMGRNAEITMLHQPVIGLCSVTDQIMDIVKADEIEQKIYVLRGQKVMIDSDLAEFYQVETRVLKQAVRRNNHRFPEDFLFELTLEETRYIESLRSQSVTLDESKRGKFSKYSSLAFTEHGAVMLASVLNSPKAIEASIQVVRAFVRLRAILTEHKELAQKIEILEKKFAVGDKNMKQVFVHLKEIFNRLPQTDKADFSQ